MANGQVITRSVGFAILRVDKQFTIDEVVFAQPGDLLLLGARTLEGLNLTVDSERKRLVAAGPVPAASFNQTLKTNRHPAAPLGAGWQFGRAPHAPTCVPGGGR